jgi:eukaryotic-like serine/threonine-protein kinase
VSGPPVSDRLAAALAERYRIERELGAGGMATVYLAADLKHDRQVAIKVLRPELAAVIGAERFLAEIKTTANLQHPHILPLFDSGEADSFLFYVMPHVEGISLRDRMTREKQLPIAEALRIATELASALDYAHRHGVIHRDIKPENIMLHDGSALVADFGIALAASKAGTRMTETGMSLGTPQYMSPEQAMGERELDARSDVYAMGCVLYEMLTGEPPFSGPTAQAIVAKVMTAEPVEMTSLRKTVPGHVADAVHTALQKLPADRFGTAAAFAEALANPGRTAGTRAASGRQGRSAWPASPRARVTTLAIAVAMGLVLLLLGRAWGRHTAPPLTTYAAQRLGGPPIAMSPRLSPDGKTIAFAAMVGNQSQIGVLNLASGDWRILTHDTTQGLAESPVWSPDGARVLYDRLADAPRGIYAVSATGESDERLILPDACSPAPLSDGSVLVLRLNADRLSQMYRYYPQSGRVDTLPAVSGAQCNAQASLIDVLPGEREAVFIAGPSTSQSIDTVSAIDLTTHKVRPLLPGISGYVSNSSLRRTPDGRSVIVAFVDGDVYRVVSVPTSGAGPITTLFTTTSWIWGIDVGSDGSIYADQVLRPIEVFAYDPATGRTRRRALSGSTKRILSLADGRILTSASSGGTTRIVAEGWDSDPIEFLASGEPSDFPVAALGPDRVMMRTTGPEGVALTIAYTVNGRIAGRIPGFDHDVVAGSPGGETIYYADSGAIWAMPSAGGAARRLHNGDAVAPSPDGRYLVIELAGAGRVRLIRLPVNGGPAQEIPVASPLPIANNLLVPNAVGPGGRILVEVVPPGLWFWPPAILDPGTGSLTIVPPGAAFDSWAGWSADGKVVGTVRSLQSTLWRFRPDAAGRGTP